MVIGDVLAWVCLIALFAGGVGAFIWGAIEGEEQADNEFANINTLNLFTD